MGKLIKWLLGAAVAIIVLLALAITAVVMFFDPNDYKDDIALALSDATGRTVTLDGDLTLSVFPWLAIETGAVSVSNAQGFGDEPMFSIGRARAGVRLGALLSGKIDVDTITISDLQVRLAADARGNTNWQDLAGDATSEPADDVDPTQATGDVPDISVAGINIENALIEYSDAATGARYRLEEFDMRLGSVDFDQPLPIAASFAFSSEADEIAGRADIDIVATFRRDTDGVISAVGLRDSEFAGEINTPALASAQPFRLSAASIDAAADEGSSLTLDDAEFEFAGLKTRLSLSGTREPMQLAGDFALSSFSPREVMQTLTGEVLELTDPDAMREASLKGQLALTDDSAALTDLGMTIDDTTLTGRLSVQGFSAPAIRFDLSGSSINLDGYLPPADETVADDATDNLAESALPVDLIKGLDARGEFRIVKHRTFPSMGPARSSVVSYPASQTVAPPSAARWQSLLPSSRRGDCPPEPRATDSPAWSAHPSGRSEENRRRAGSRASRGRSHSPPRRGGALPGQSSSSWRPNHRYRRCGSQSSLPRTMRHRPLQRHRGDRA